MIKRTDIENREFELLSVFAAKSRETRGRCFDEEKCPMRTDYQRDRDRITHSKSFRRLMHKTQVFLSPEGDNYRTRLTHTLEVSQIARTISRNLALNEDLTEAIALGHDLGHTPFGHNGEDILNEIYKGGFKHNEQSLRVVDILENNSSNHGMNLTFEVRDGILNHTGEKTPITLEGQIVKISDRIAYINHDIDDAIRSGVITACDLPKDCIRVLGISHRERIDKLVNDLVANSWEKNRITMSEECLAYMNKLRSFMFENVYHSPKVKKHEDLSNIENVIRQLYDYYINHPNMLPEDKQAMIELYGINTVVKDQIAGMTDRYAFNKHREFTGHQL